MKKSFVDTNIFVEAFVRKGVKSNRSFKLFNLKHNLCTSSLVISEIEWVMRSGYEIGKKDIVRSMKRILTSDIEIDDKKLLIEVLNYFEFNNVDWTDCLNIFLMRDRGVSDVYSYDKGLQKFPWVKRHEP